MRLGNAGNGVLHLGFASSIARLLGTGSAGAGTDATATDGTAQLLGQPFGRLLVALIGQESLGYVGYQLFQACKAKFRENARLRRMSAREEWWYTALGRADYAARGVLSGSIGLFLLVAARNADPQEARGLDTALADLTAHPFGHGLLGVVALGLIAHGFFLLGEARFHRVRVA